MVEKILISIGSVIMLSLGSLHLIYTFFSEKFRPWNVEAETAMKATSPRLTKRTTMWKAWMGFNGSHSLGAIYFGIINLLMVNLGMELFYQSLSIMALNLVTLFFFLFLAIQYWFRIPLIGIIISTICYCAAYTLIFFSK